MIFPRHHLELLETAAELREMAGLPVGSQPQFPTTKKGIQRIREVRATLDHLEEAMCAADLGSAAEALTEVGQAVGGMVVDLGSLEGGSNGGIHQAPGTKAPFSNAFVPIGCAVWQDPLVDKRYYP